MTSATEKLTKHLNDLFLLMRAYEQGSGLPCRITVHTKLVKELLDLSETARKEHLEDRRQIDGMSTLRREEYDRGYSDGYAEAGDDYEGGRHA